MAIHGRRTFLQLLGALGVTASAGRADAAQQPMSQMDARKLAIGTLRIVNTLQLRGRYRDKREGFLALPDLVQTDHAIKIFSTLRDKGFVSFESGAIATSKQLLPGFDTVFELSPDGQRYSVTLTDATGTLSVRTDQTAIIYHSLAQSIEMQGQLVYQPIRMEHHSEPATRLGKLTAAVMNAVFPVVHAQAFCCTVYCNGACEAYPSPESCFENCEFLGNNCCNMGYMNCLWCCSGDFDCSGCWFC
jgi:hypothetical protein